jgi:uncharacterized membrane protein YbaN (DUF454 family)
MWLAAAAYEAYNTGRDWKRQPLFSRSRQQFSEENAMPNSVTLIAALALIALWIGLVVAQVPSGWIHLPLAVGTTLLVRWIALHDLPESLRQR